MILITGGAGLIGSNLVHHFNRLGRTDIVIVDHLAENPFKWKNLAGLKYTDYFERDKLNSALERYKHNIRTIFHLGACSNTMEKNATYLIENNFQISKDLFFFSQEINARFIYASSAATYGDGENGYEDSAQIIDALRPLNMYGYSKQMFDQWLLRNNGLDKVVGLKYFNVYGPNEYHKEDMRSLVLKAFYQIKAEGKIHLFKSYRKEYADGEQKRDFLYVKDAVKMTAFFSDKPQLSGLFNVGSSVSRSWNDLAKAIFSSLNLEPRIAYIEMPDHLKDTYQYFTQADSSKIIRSGYSEPLYSLESAVKDYVQHYLISNKHL